MLDYGELKKVVNNIENKKDRWHINFTAKHPVVWIYRKIGWTECQLIIDTDIEVLVCIKLIVDLLKLKPKANKTMTVVIDEVK